MSRPTNAEKHAKIHAEALALFNRIQSAQQETRLQCLEDRRFYSIAGAQWEGPLGEQFDNRPRLEFNKVHLAVIRIINEYRNNRITVDFQTPDGSTDDEMADACDGLFRADEKYSTADEAYDNAFEEAVGGGFGAFRLCAKYENEDDDEDDRQRVHIEPIVDADSCVFFDLSAKRYDKADAKHCFVLTGTTPDAYKEEWGDDPATWPKEITRSEFDWCGSDFVYVAEFYKVEEVSDPVMIFRSMFDGSEKSHRKSELDADPAIQDVLTATGYRLAREKKSKRKKVHKYLMSGGKILEDCGYIAGSCIPIVPVYGKRWFVDGIERCMGHVRLAKDAQRLTNSLMSWLADMAGRFDIEKPILTPEQIAGHAQQWADDNISRYPYLLINPITDATGQQVASGPVGYTKAPTVPPAMAALVQLAEQGLSDLLGKQEAGEQMQSNISGKVVELVQNRLDMQVFIYMSNLAKSMKRCGEIWLSMMKDIAVEPDRKMKTIDKDGQVGAVVLNQPMFDTENGEDYLENDLSKAMFEVDVDVGPSSSSRRSSTVRSLTALISITEDPATKQALTLAAIANIEGEGLQDLRDWARASAVRAGVVKPTEEELQKMAEEQANQQPDPQAQLAGALTQQALADAEKKRADTVNALASADLKAAQAQKVAAETDGARVSSMIDAADAIQRVSTPPDQVMPMAPPTSMPTL